MQPGGHICDAAVTTRNCPESIRAKGHLARSLGMCPPGMVKKVSLIADGEYGTLAPSATTPGICPVYPGGHSGTNPQFTGHLVSCSGKGPACLPTPSLCGDPVMSGHWGISAGV